MKSEELGKDRRDITERCIAYSLQIICLYRKLQKDGIGKVLGGQLLRAGTSVGANVHEAQGAQSKADFIAKMSVAYKETRESLYWIHVIRRSNTVHLQHTDALLDETEQLGKILSSILLSSKEQLRPSPILHS